MQQSTWDWPPSRGPPFFPVNNSHISIKFKQFTYFIQIYWACSWLTNRRHLVQALLPNITLSRNVYYMYVQASMCIYYIYIYPYLCDIICHLQALKNKCKTQVWPAKLTIDQIQKAGHQQGPQRKIYTLANNLWKGINRSRVAMPGHLQACLDGVDAEGKVHAIVRITFDV